MRSIAHVTALALGAVLVACTASGPPSPTAPNPTATAMATATAVAATPTASPSGPPTVGRCAGDDLLWEQLPQPVQAYTFAWTDREAAGRLEGLQNGMTDDAQFVDSTLNEPIVGHEALSAYIGEFLDARPGHYFAMRELIPADRHNGYIRLRWMLCNPSGQPVLDGEEVATLDANGMITHVVRFLDNP